MVAKCKIVWKFGTKWLPRGWVSADKRFTILPTSNGKYYDVVDLDTYKERRVRTVPAAKSVACAMARKKR